jgi:hypothetical protein
MTETGAFSSPVIATLAGERQISEEEILAFEQKLLMPGLKGGVRLLDDSLLDELLEGYRLSATNLNKYLTCPVTFYFENILKVPMVKSMPMTYGSCFHRALELVYRDFIAGQSELPERASLYFSRVVFMFSGFLAHSRTAPRSLGIHTNRTSTFTSTVRMRVRILSNTPDSWPNTTMTGITAISIR